MMIYFSYNPKPKPIYCVDRSRKFTVTIRNMSNETTLEGGEKLTGIAMRNVPLSEGPWVVFPAGKGSVFTVGQPASNGLERLVEDGLSAILLNDLNNSSWVSSTGKFISEGKRDDDPVIKMGESSTFNITAKPGDKLQIVSMFEQSNDWFYSFKDGGLSLFNGDVPISGDVTSMLQLYDAGTESDEPLGLGTTQKTDQGAFDINIGIEDSINKVMPANGRHLKYRIPANVDVIRVTVKPQ